jgi:hypothetical protein
MFILRNVRLLSGKLTLNQPSAVLSYSSVGYTFAHCVHVLLQRSAVPDTLVLAATLTFTACRVRRVPTSAKR